LATYFDLRYSSTHQFHVWVMTVKLLGIFWLVILGFGLLYQLWVRRSDRWPLSRDTLRHFWPGRGYAFRYYQVLGGILLGVFILGFAYCFVQPVAQFYLLLTVLVQLFLLSFRFTRLWHMQELTPLTVSL
jgi:hypothetical protein